MIRLSVPEILQPGFFVTEKKATEELDILVSGCGATYVVRCHLGPWEWLDEIWD